MSQDFSKQLEPFDTPASAFMEALAGERLDHKYLIKSQHKIDTKSNTLTLNSARGVPLPDLLGLLSLGDIQRFMAELACIAAELANKQLVHADIKPDNIVIVDDALKLIDLESLASIHARPGQTHSTMGFYEEDLPTRENEIHAVLQTIRAVLYGNYTHMQDLRPESAGSPAMFRRKDGKLVDLSEYTGAVNHFSEGLLRKTEHLLWRLLHQEQVSFQDIKDILPRVDCPELQVKIKDFDPSKYNNVGAKALRTYWEDDSDPELHALAAFLMAHCGSSSACVNLDDYKEVYAEMTNQQKAVFERLADSLKDSTLARGVRELIRYLKGETNDEWLYEALETPNYNDPALGENKSVIAAMRSFKESDPGLLVEPLKASIQDMRQNFTPEMDLLFEAMRLIKS